MSVAKPLDEAGRLAALRRLELMDTAAEPEFDELVEIAAAICETPMSLITLLDERRQWFKASVGMKVQETSREVAFCDHTIRQPDVMLVEDAENDPRFRDNPLVTGEMHLRFYAGVPVSSPDGYRLGSLCVLDRVPRKLTATQLMALQVLGKQANARLDLREQRRALEQALAAAETARVALAVSESRFKTFMDSGPFLSYLKDREGRYVFYNQFASEHYGIGPTDWLNKTDMELFPAEIAATFRANDNTVISSGKILVVEERTVDANGGVTIWRSYKFPVADGASVLVGGISVDITHEAQQTRALQRSQRELEAANARLHEMATTDPLTGLANRRAFDARMAAEFALAQRKQRALCVMMLDADNFKLRNDLYGHDMGDASLKQLAALLAECVSDSDMVARYGGEEFVLLLPETNAQQALHLGNRILESVRAADWICGPLTVSAGIAEKMETTTSPQQLLVLADDALYAAKHGGKDQVRVWEGPR